MEPNELESKVNYTHYFSSQVYYQILYFEYLFTWNKQFYIKNWQTQTGNTLLLILGHNAIELTGYHTQVRKLVVFNILS